MSCEMGQEHLGNMIGDSAKREQFVNTLATLIKEKQLNGLLLDCDSQMRGSMRTNFIKLLNEINDEFGEGKEGDAQNCISKLAIKIQLSRTNINEVYETEQLNKLLRFILLPSGFAVFITKAKIMNPLYTKGINNQNEDMINTQNGTFWNWMDEQLNANKIVMELPTFGIKQIRENGTAEPTIVSRNEICEFMRQPNARQTIRYDAVAAFWKTQGKWLSAENGQTMAYKTKFTIQHQMRGIMVNSLDMDDPENLCNHEGPFPMLEIVHKSKCEKKSKMTNNAHVERDLLSNMMMSRGRH